MWPLDTISLHGHQGFTIDFDDRDRAGCADHVEHSNGSLCGRGWQLLAPNARSVGRERMFFNLEQAVASYQMSASGEHDSPRASATDERR